MRFLLDTHAFLWFALDDASLSLTAKQIIEDRTNEVLVSPASYWEISIKISLGKYKLKQPYEEFWRVGMSNNGFKVLPIEIRHTTMLLTLPFHHKDPFDRLLTAPALAEEIPIISDDTLMDQYGVQRVW